MYLDANTIPVVYRWVARDAATDETMEGGTFQCLPEEMTKVKDALTEHYEDCKVEVWPA